MAKTWVLDTETKATGATMVPLDDAPRRPAPAPEPFWVPPVSAPHPEPAPEPRRPRRFRVVDVVSRYVLAKDVDARELLEVLAGVDRLVDISISVWDPEHSRWRLLTLDEQRAVWASRPAAG